MSNKINVVNALVALVVAVAVTAPLKSLAVESTEAVPMKQTSTGSLPLPSAANTWKTSVSSVYYDMVGTQAADNRTYGFGASNVSINSFSLEKALAPDWKVLAKVQYISNAYDLQAGSRVYHETTEGLADSYIGVSHPLIVEEGFRFFADAGVLLPTGSIDEANAFVPNAHYKYFLQLGSGTFDGVLGLTSLYIQRSVVLGARLSEVERNGQNKNGYRLGNWTSANIWADAPLKHGFTPRLTANYRLKEGIEGADPTINRVSAKFYYGQQMDWSISTALKYEYVFTPNLNLSTELGAPIMQGMKNDDNVVIATHFYGSMGLVGQF